MAWSALYILLPLLFDFITPSPSCGTSYMSFNSFLVPGFDYERRLNSLVRALAKEDADVICLQEVWLEKDIRQVCKYLDICMLLKVIFSEESGQNFSLVIPTQYDGRSHVKSGWLFYIFQNFQIF